LDEQALETKQYDIGGILVSFQVFPYAKKMMPWKKVHPNFQIWLHFGYVYMLNIFSGREMQK